MFHGKGLADILVDEGQNIVHLMIVFVTGICHRLGIGIGEGVYHHHQLHKGSLFNNVMGVASGRGNLVNIVEKAFLVFLVQGKLVLEGTCSVRETVGEVRFGGGNFFDEIRVDGENNPFMELIVNLGQFMAFILVDDTSIPGGNGIKAVVNQKLLAAGNGVIQFAAVMNVHLHGFFFFIQVGNGKGFCAGTVIHCNFTGAYFFHIDSHAFPYPAGLNHRIQ